MMCRQILFGRHWIQCISAAIITFAIGCVSHTCPGSFPFSSHFFSHSFSRPGKFLQGRVFLYHSPLPHFQTAGQTVWAEVFYDSFPRMRFAFHSTSGVHGTILVSSFVMRYIAAVRKAFCISSAIGRIFTTYDGPSLLSGTGHSRTPTEMSFPPAFCCSGLMGIVFLLMWRRPLLGVDALSSYEWGGPPYSFYG